MASSGPWGALPQSNSFANATRGVIGDAGTNTDPQYSDVSTSTEDLATTESVARHQDETVTDIARQLTHKRYSVKAAGGNDYVNPFIDTNDPQLNPRSDKFSPKAWVKNLVGIQSRDPERYPTRVAGISYQNLSVHGFGTPTDYQKTFGNYPLEIATIFKKLTGRGTTKIQILRDFEGLVKSGEMLVVLGRPGSGCSTLLKTIAGETDGFYVDSQSHINYQGP